MVQGWNGVCLLHVHVTKLLYDVLERVDSALDAQADVVRRRHGWRLRCHPFLTSAGECGLVRWSLGWERERWAAWYGDAELVCSCWWCVAGLLGDVLKRVHGALTAQADVGRRRHGLQPHCRPP